MPNRLASESSPYLLQHAHNPVDWFAWGEEALSEARRRDVSIFLSIGYSTCYWCHVMERECFENDAIAKQMNAGFVNIKVDREQRPDLDDLYMVAVQMLTGHGGWPMSVFLDPHSLRPFWGGTYFPPTPARGMPSFPQVLDRMSAAYRDQREDVLKQAEQVTQAMRERLAAHGAPVPIGPEQVQMGVQTLLTILDRQDGGFGRAPKFPQPVYLEFLLAARSRVDAQARNAIDAALKLTLDRMAIGGIFDQLAGGFHRYSVDTYWLVPHFEKMLYDQGQLISVYAQASVALGDAFYASVAKRIAQYIEREMTDASGAFCSAQDAEVDGREGLNYLWISEEFERVLGADATWAADVFGVAQGPNFQDPHHASEPARNVLRLDARPELVAHRLKMGADVFAQKLASVSEKLLTARKTRKQPRLDDKLITSWNGLMIEGLARAGRLLGDESMIAQARKAADVMLASMRSTRGLIRSQRQGRGEAMGVLEDYAMLACGLIELHRAGAKPLGGGSYLSASEQLMSEAREKFTDERGWHDTRGDQRDLVLRARSTYDGAMASGVSVTAHAWLALAELTGERAYLMEAIGILVSISAAIAESPLATCNSTRALLEVLTRDGEALQQAVSASRAKAAASVQHAGDGGMLVDPTSLVEVYSSSEDVELAPDEPAELTLRVVIPEGYHINSASAADESGGSLVPLHVGITGGTGVRAYADYPMGEKYGSASHTVHHGAIEFVVALELEGDWSGAPKLVVSFQMCSDRACMSPSAVVLDVVIRRG